MTANNEHLDRAIVVAQERVFNNQERVVDQLDRTYARALIAELLRDMDEPPLDPPAILGWDLAIKIIKRRAGLEGEG